MRSHHRRTCRRVGLLAASMAALALAACAGPRDDGLTAVNPHPEATGQPHPEFMRKVALKRRDDERWSCVPFARELSGISLRGDAWVWWDKAAHAGYARGRSPREGAVMVFSRTSRLTRGHLSVVSAVLGPREVLVDHANWGDTYATRGKQYWGVRVIDVSKANDWSAVRVWWAPGDVMGSRVYPLQGFIYNDLTVAQNTVE